MKRLCKIAVFLLVAGLILAVAGGIWGGHLYLPWDRGNAVDWDVPSDRSSVTEVSDFSANALSRVTALDLDVDAVALVIEEGPDWKLESDFDDKYLTANVNGSTLYIKADRSRRWWHTRHHTVVLTVPKGLTLDVFSCDLDAGAVDVDTIAADTAVLEVDAGAMDVGTLYAGSLDASCSAGAICLSARLTENSSLEVDAGSIELSLLDGSKLETVAGSANLGSIQINGKEYSGLESNFSVPLTDRSIDSHRWLDVRTDLGSIEITSAY